MLIEHLSYSRLWMRHWGLWQRTQWKFHTWEFLSSPRGAYSSGQKLTIYKSNRQWVRWWDMLEGKIQEKEAACDIWAKAWREGQRSTQVCKRTAHTWQWQQPVPRPWNASDVFPVAEAACLQAKWQDRKVRCMVRDVTVHLSQEDNE